MSDQIDRLLVEAKMSHDVVLRGLLTRLHRDATSVRPMPSVELAALMVPIRSASAIRRRGGAITALLVIGTLGVGVTAAAASPAVRTGAEQVIQAVMGTAPHGPSVPVPAASHDATHSTPAPGRSNSAAPHPGPTDHPGPGDHPNDQATHAASPQPSPSHGAAPGAGHAGPTDDPGKGHKG